jgi:hypothetical protein
MTSASVWVPTASAMYTTPGRKKASSIVVARSPNFERAHDRGGGQRAHQPEDEPGLPVGDAAPDGLLAGAPGRAGAAEYVAEAHEVLLVRSLSRTASSLRGGTSPTKRPESSTTARRVSPWSTAVQAATSWSVPGATTGGSRSISVSMRRSVGAASTTSAGTRPTSLPASHTTTSATLS